jgi:hypothetical protein
LTRGKTAIGNSISKQPELASCSFNLEPVVFLPGDRLDCDDQHGGRFHRNQRAGAESTYPAVGIGGDARAVPSPSKKIPILAELRFAPQDGGRQRLTAR